MNNNTKIIVTIGDLITIHNNLATIRTSGEDTITNANCMVALRRMLENPQIYAEPVKEEPADEQDENE